MRERYHIKAGAVVAKCPPKDRFRIPRDQASHKINTKYMMLASLHVNVLIYAQITIARVLLKLENNSWISKAKENFEKHKK